MPMYRVTVRDGDGVESVRVVEASVAEGARAAMEEAGLEVVQVRREWGSAPPRPGRRYWYEVGTIAPSGAHETHRIEAGSPDEAEAAMLEAGHRVTQVIYAGRAGHTETIGAMAPDDFGWLITKHVVIALAIWWVISTLLGLLLVGMFGGAFTVGG